MPDKELIKQYLANGGTITKVPKLTFIPAKFTGELEKTNVLTPKVYVDYFGKPSTKAKGRRQYQFLNSKYVTSIVDETVLNYG